MARINPNAPIASPPPPSLADLTGDDIDVQIVPDDTEDDGTIVNLGEAKVPAGVKKDAPFDANLAEYMDEQELGMLGSELFADVDADARSRTEWEEMYKKGIGLLGLRIEERNDPWPGACGIVHPILAESCVRFQAEVITETFPADGPVKTKIIGQVTPEREQAASRVRDDMNYELVNCMPEYRAEHERLLWNLPIAGSAFKKVYYDPTLGRQASMFVSAEDFIVAYGASDLSICPRYAQVMRKTPNDLAKLMQSGFYREVDLGDPVNDITDIEEEKNKVSGQDQGIKADYHKLLEISVDLQLPEFDGDSKVALPYLVTMDKHTQTILSIYRNWKQDDPEKKKHLHFVHYQYIPGFGFYGLGLVHLVGGFAEGATAILRQLVDAGTLSNLPGGLKTRGLRIKGDDDPIGPGEWRDVDVLAGSLKDNLMPLPYKEPSQVLADLLEKIIEEGRKFAAVAEMKVSDFDSNSPVGTTMALLERTLKVMSSVQARVYNAMMWEFKLLKAVITDRMRLKPDTAIYKYTPDGGDPSTKPADYALVDILPVADPNAATMSQRIVQYQAAMQLASTAPQIYDLPQLHGQMLSTLGIKNVDKLIPTLNQRQDPMDPVSENMAILMGKPVKAFLTQDHDSHITVHMMAMQDPLVQQMVGQNPQAQAIMAAGQAHLMEHIGFKYRQMIEKALGTQLPPPDQPLPPDIEVQLSGLIAQAAPKVLAMSQSEAAQKQAQQAAQDPVLQAEMMDQQNKAREIARKEAKDKSDRDMEVRKLLQKDENDKRQAELEKARIDAQSAGQGAQIGSQAAIAAQRNQVDLAKQSQQHQHDKQSQDAQHTHEAHGKVFDFAKEGITAVADKRHEAQQADREHQQSLQQAEQANQHQQQATQASQQHEVGMAAMNNVHDRSKQAADQQHKSVESDKQLAAAEKTAKAAKAKPAKTKKEPKK